MSDHIFDPSTQTCLGCGVAAREVADAPRGKGQIGSNCRAYFTPITNGGQHFLAVVTTDEHLRLYRDGGLVIDFDAHAMFAIRDAVDEGAARVRRG